MKKEKILFCQKLGIVQISVVLTEIKISYEIKLLEDWRFNIGGFEEAVNKASSKIKEIIKESGIIKK
jgi:hypothetical protein